MKEPEFGRFSDPAILILSSLAGGEKHGYAMMEDIKITTGVSLGPGTLYGALTRLERSHFIEAVPSKDRRRPYHITPQGSAYLRQYLSDLASLVSLGLKRLTI